MAINRFTSYFKLVKRLGRTDLVNNPYAQSPQVLDRNLMDMNISDQNTAASMAYQGSHKPARPSRMLHTHITAPYLNHQYRQNSLFHYGLLRYSPWQKPGILQQILNPAPDNEAEPAPQHQHDNRKGFNPTPKPF